MGFSHPDELLQKLTSRQIAEWYAFATLEQVGNPIPSEPESPQAKRARIESGLRALKDKFDKRGK